MKPCQDKSPQSYMGGTPAEFEQWNRLFAEVQNEANKRLLEHQVRLVARAANPLAWGACFVGYDAEKRVYEVTLVIPSSERRNQMAAGREAFLLWMTNMVVDAVLGQQEWYLRLGAARAAIRREVDLFYREAIRREVDLFYRDSKPAEKEGSRGT